MSNALKRRCCQNTRMTSRPHRLGPRPLSKILVWNAKLSSLFKISSRGTRAFIFPWKYFLYHQFSYSRKNRGGKISFHMHFKDRLWVRIYIFIYIYFLFLYFSIKFFLRGSVGVVHVGGPWTGPWGGPWTQSVGLVHGPGVSVFGSPEKKGYLAWLVHFAKFDMCRNCHDWFTRAD